MDTLQLSRQLQCLELMAWSDRRKPLWLHYLSEQGRFLRVSNTQCTDQRSNRHYTMCVCVCVQRRWVSGVWREGWFRQGKSLSHCQDLKAQCQNTNTVNTTKTLVHFFSTRLPTALITMAIFNIKSLPNTSFQYQNCYLYLSLGNINIFNLLFLI